MHSRGFTFIELLVIITLISLFSIGGAQFFASEIGQSESSAIEKRVRLLLSFSALSAQNGLADGGRVLFSLDTPVLFRSETFSSKRYSNMLALPYDLHLDALIVPSANSKGSAQFSWHAPRDAGAVQLQVRSDDARVRTVVGAEVSDISWADELHFRVCRLDFSDRCSNEIALFFFDREALLRDVQAVSIDHIAAERNAVLLPVTQMAEIRIDSEGRRRLFVDGKEVSRFSVLLKKPEESGLFLFFP